MPPLAEPPAGILKSLRETAEVIRHRFPGPEALEDLQRGYRQLAKMPVNNPHVGDPGVQSGKVVLYGPGGAGVRNRILSTELGDGCLRAYLRIREHLCGEIKRSRYENTTVREESL
jgi:hypothetical protein